MNIRDLQIIDTLPRGDSVIYHRGSLMFDRVRNPEVNTIASAVWRAYEAGKVLLIQKRLEPSICAYIAVKR